MKSTKSVLYISLLLLLFTLSCNKDDHPSTPLLDQDITKYFPLKTGAIWLYKYPTNFFGNDIVFDVRVEVISKSDDGLFTVTWTYYDEEGNSSLVGSENYKVVTDGILIFDDQNNQIGYLFKLPYEVNNTWEINYENGTKTIFTIIGTNITYTTPIGIFNNCLRIKLVTFYHSGTISDDMIRVYAPDVGLIAMEEAGLVISFYSIPR